MNEIEIDIKRERELESLEEQREEEYREVNEKSFLIKFKGTIYIDALDKDEAESRFKDRADIAEYIDEVDINE